MIKRNTFTMASAGQHAFTMAARLSRFHNGLMDLRSAFTMAEILLSLTIIGVVAAITLPSLTGNINERTWNTQRKALLSRMSQAVALMPTMNGYGSDETNAAETFITSGLSKVLKINNICGYGTAGEKLYDCGFASQFVDANGTKQNLPLEVKSLNAGIINNTNLFGIQNTKAAAFETANGESVLTFYNPKCTAENVLKAGNDGEKDGMSIKQHLCVNFVYDLNGKKGPNTVGKDIGALSIFYSSDPKAVMPMYPKALSGAKTHSNTMEACHNLDEGQYRLPNIEELVSVYYNRLLFTSPVTAGDVWASTSADATHAYTIGNNTGLRFTAEKTSTFYGFCVER